MTANIMRREDNAQPSRLLLDVSLVGARTKQTLGACFPLLSALGSKAGVCGCTSPCPLWVISGHMQCKRARPLYTQ
jgi:hypothetical protein